MCVVIMYIHFFISYISVVAYKREIYKGILFNMRDLSISKD
jgi:hypothetical protein